MGSKGDTKANLVLVGESPGAQEVVKGRPFSGPSGTILHTYIPEGRALVLNAMECSPKKTKKDQNSLGMAANTCHQRLVDRIGEHPRRLIVAMGNPAVWSLTGDYKLKITQIRGQLIPSPLAELGILPVIHPAALMRGTGNFRQFRQDLQKALALANGEPIKPYPFPNYVVVTDPKELRERVRSMLEDTNDLTGDIETSGLHHAIDWTLTFGISVADNIKHPAVVFDSRLIPAIKRYLESSHVEWCWHNGKFDIQFFWDNDIRAKVDDDTMLMSYALDERRGVHDLEQVAGDHLGAPDYKNAVLRWKGKKTDPRSPHYYMYQHDPEGLFKYMAYDLVNTAKLRPLLKARIEDDKQLKKLYHKTLIPSSQLVAEVEYNGIHVDPQWLNDIDEIVYQQVQDAAKAGQEAAGWDLNMASNAKDIPFVLFKQLKLPNKYKGSADKDVLKKLNEDPKTRHPFIGALINYRKAAKIYGTYIKGLRTHIRSDGRVYATFLLHGTVTGRLASRKPNLQNIPRDWLIRGIFDAAPGYVLVEVDLSQAELRCLAAMSNDERMIEVFSSGGDIHTELARFLFPGWDDRKALGENSFEGQQAKEERTKCKNVNFGIVYGITEYGLQDQIGGELSASVKMIEGWGERFPQAFEFIDSCRSAPRNRITITTPFGRKKRAGIVTNENLSFLENEAANFPHQSSVSDFTLHAMRRSQPFLKGNGCRIVNLIHDAGLIEVPIHQGFGLVSEVVAHVKGHMEQVPKDWGVNNVPFVADAKAGDRWGSLEDYHLEAA